MKSTNLIVGSVAAVALGSILTACSGGSSPQAAPNAIPVGAAQIQPAGVLPDMKCMSKNGVSVHPCSVKLTVENPTANVTTKGPAKGTFSVDDTRCTTNMIATVTGSGNTYVVTAGTSNGTCTAKFDDKDQNGKRIGSAKLMISNKSV